MVRYIHNANAVTMIATVWSVQVIYHSALSAIKNPSQTPEQNRQAKQHHRCYDTCQNSDASMLYAANGSKHGHKTNHR